MCVLVDRDIIRWALAGGVTPYNPEQVNPASYDLTLASDVIDLNTGEHIIIDGAGLKLYHGRAVLATTVETVYIPITIVGSVALKSTSARSGIDHALAGWIDPGFRGQITLELSAHRDVVLHVGQRLAQIVLTSTHGVPDRAYGNMPHSHYQDQVGVTPARFD